MNRFRNLATLLTIVLFGNIHLMLAQSFYDKSVIQEIKITFTQSNWDYLLDTAKAGSEGYIIAQKVSINGVEFDFVGVKYKGNSTYKATNVKNPFHIELDTYKEQDYSGYKDIKLSNVQMDPSFIREVLSYSIAQKYMDAPLSNYANVYVNNVLIGLYVSSESVGNTFVKSRFSTKENAFFKCTPIGGADPNTSKLPNLVYLGEDSTLYMTAYEIQSDGGWAELLKLIKTLKDSPTQIETILDVDRALWMLAFNNVLVNLDSYSGQFAQNYYLYQDNNGRFLVIPWDLNMSFGVFNMTGSINLATTTNKIQMSHLLHQNDANWPLISKLLTQPKYKRQYFAHMKTMVKENFVSGSYSTEASTYQTLVANSVQADPNKFFTYAQFTSNLTTDITGTGGPGGGMPAPGITNLMANRSTYLLGLSDLKAMGPVISEISSTNSNPLTGSSVSIRARFNNANSNSQTLAYRSDKTKPFSKISMVDDGNHSDGSAGDGIFGADIVASGSEIQYYLYAENDTIASFSPERAEHEFYLLPVKTSTGSVVLLNEIWSRGTASDPDWIEIYNTSDESVNLVGYKIYDSGGFSGSKPKKVLGSEAIIPAKGFLVVITDDTSDSGFGLSNSGEKVWFETPAGLLADTVTYAGHTATESYGRVPDGGEWKLLSVITKGSSNGGTAVDEIKASPNAFALHQNYPNPFNPVTTIPFSLQKEDEITISVYNVLGEMVTTIVQGFFNAGNHSVSFDAGNLTSGTYIYVINSSSGLRASKKLMLLK